MRVVFVLRCWISRCGRLAWLGLLLLPPGLGAADGAEEIVRNMAEHSAEMARRLETQTVTCIKSFVKEQVGQDGEVKSREETLRLVRWHDGKAKVQILAEERQDLDERKGAFEGESGEQEDATQGRKVDDKEERPFVLRPELLAKYDFVLQGEEVVEGRRCHVLSFRPREGLPERGVVDRFMNRVAGRVWVDGEEFAVAKAELHLQEPVVIWGGVLGALRSFYYSLERVRIGEGWWFSRSSESWFELRRLLVTRGYRTRSEWRELRLEPADRQPESP